MAGRYSLTVINDLLALVGVPDILTGQPGAFVAEDSIVRVWATRESVDVLMGITIGRDVVLPVRSPANIVAAVGSLPSRQDDLIAESGAFAGQQIIINGANANVAAQELRVIVEVTPVGDVGLFSDR